MEIEPKASLLSRNNILLIAAKSCAEVVRKVFCSCLILLHFFTLLQIFCPGLSSWKVSCLWLVSVSFKLQYFHLLWNLKPFSNVSCKDNVQQLRKGCEFNSSLLTHFLMFDLCQNASLESFQLWLMYFWI